MKSFVRDDFEKILKGIQPADKEVRAKAQARLDSLTKPKGSLGRLEECAIAYVSARGDLQAEIRKPVILTFAGDHGVAEEGVSAFPSEVTRQMIANFSSGGAAINVLTRYAGAALKVIDVGVAGGKCDFPCVIDRKVASGTRNFTKGPAMTEGETLQAIYAGYQEAESAIKEGSTLLGTGDMGIANTTPSAALYSVYLNVPPELSAGRGTGINDQALAHKLDVIKKAVEVNRKRLDTPLGVLSALGGLEIAGICGVIISAAAHHVPVVVDGFISGAAAIAAIKMNESIADYCIFSHLSAEAGHRNVMLKFGARPLLDLDMRLGEGTGATLAFNIIGAGLKIMNEMATFEQAGVTNKDK